MRRDMGCLQSSGEVVKTPRADMPAGFLRRVSCAGVNCSSLFPDGTSIPSLERLSFFNVLVMVRK